MNKFWVVLVGCAVYDLEGIRRKGGAVPLQPTLLFLKCRDAGFPRPSS